VNQKGLQVKLRDLVTSESALYRLSQKDMSAHLSFLFARVLKVVGEHMDLKREAHKKMLAKYGMPENSGDPELTAQIEKEYVDLLDTDITLVGIGKIKTSLLDADGVRLPAQDANALRWLLKNDIVPDFDFGETPETEN